MLILNGRNDPGVEKAKDSEGGGGNIFRSEVLLRAGGGGTLVHREGRLCLL